MEFTIKITQEEGQIILSALGKQPFEQVASVISNIQQQASEQMENAKPNKP